jgi:hypothetical protein
MEHSRRSFLSGITGVAGTALSFNVASQTSSAVPHAVAATLANVRNFLEIDGVIVGQLVRSAGGGLIADVEETLAPDGTFYTKRPITPRVTPFEFATTIGMDVAFWQRVGAILSHSQVPFGGAIVRADANLNVKERIEFEQAVFSAASVGELDAKSLHQDTEFNFKLDVGKLVRVAGSGKVSAPTKSKKRSFNGNFQFVIDGIKDSDDIIAVDSFGVVQPVERRSDGTPILGPLETSPVTIYIRDASLKDVLQWFEKLAIAGETSDERTGTLTGLSANFQTVVWTVRFFNLGVFAIQPDPSRVGESTPPSSEVSMYFETSIVTLGPLPSEE